MTETSDVSNKRHYVYVLYSLLDTGFYIGFTSDLKERLIKHAKGLVKATKIRRPFKLIHYEYFINERMQKLERNTLRVVMGEKI